MLVGGDEKIMKKILIGIVVIIFIGAIGMYAWSIVDPEGYQAYQAQVDARIEADRARQEAEEQERKKIEEAPRICDNKAFNEFAVRWNNDHPDERITKDMVEEQSDLVGRFKFENIEVCMQYHESSPVDSYEGYYYGIRDRKNVGLSEFCENATPYLRDVYKLSVEDINTIIDSIKSGNYSCNVNGMEYWYEEEDWGKCQSIRWRGH